MYAHVTLHGQFELQGEHVDVELDQNFVDDVWIHGRVSEASISLFPVDSDVFVRRSNRSVTLILPGELILPEEAPYTGSTFSFMILREGRWANSYILVGAETLSDFTIEVQLRDEGIDDTALTAFVLNSNFPGIRAGTGVVVTRNQWDVIVEELF